MTSPGLLRTALASATVLADAADAGSTVAVADALADARAGGALDGALAAEAAGLEAALRGPSPGAALARLSALLEEPALAAAPAGPADRWPADAETAEIVGEFVGEASEHLARVDDALLAAETSGHAPDAHALFRAFHTVKGMAGFLELPDVVATAHAAEALLEAVRGGRAALTGPALELCLEAAGELRALVEGIRAGLARGRRPERSARAGALERRVAALLAGDADPGPAQAAAPAPAAAAEHPAPVHEDGRRTEPHPRPAPHAPHALRETVKVDVERVDGLVDLAGELLVLQSMIAHAPEVAGAAGALRAQMAQLSKLARDVQGAAMRMRMVPVQPLFRRMVRLARDVARRTGKELAIEVSGGDTEMDRSIVERLEAPLVHLVRNAVDHGVEPATARRAAGKPAVATLRLSARSQAGAVEVELSDDGRGLDRAAILARARARGLVGPDATPAPAEVDALVFEPGFSTADAVTEISGRGVGMDVVRRVVEAMRGRVTLASTPGAGTRVTLALPATLVTIDGLLVSVGRERYVLPSLQVREALRPAARMLASAAERAELLQLRGEALPLLRLRRLLGVDDGAEPPLTEAQVVVIEAAARRYALAVDAVAAHQQVVVRPVSDALAEASYVAGAAILPDGRVGLILDLDRLPALAAEDARAAAGARR